MDVRLHQVAQGVVYQAMLGDWPRPGEARGSDANPEVPPTVFRSFVAGMEVAFVDDVQRRWFQRHFQPLSN